MANNDDKKILKEIDNVYELIKNKQLNKAEEKIDKLIQNTPNIQINEYGRIFDFETELQFVFYCKEKSRSNTCWEKNHVSDLYYTKGIILFEKDQYLEAITQMKNSLKYNPMKISAYMEIMECYIRLKDMNSFFKVFDEAIKIALTPSEISQIYRKYAFILIDFKNYELAYNILRYTYLIFPRKENENEIKYLSSIAKVNLPLTPNIGTIEYIRKNNLEYKPNPNIINTYMGITNAIEKELNEKKDMNQDNRINYYKRLVDLYNNLYFFYCNEQTHELLIRTTQLYLHYLNAKNNTQQ